MVGVDSFRVGFGETRVSVFENQNCWRGPSGITFVSHVVSSRGPGCFDLGWVRIPGAECWRRVLCQSSM